MPPEIFSEVVRPTVKLGSRSRYTVPLSIAVHAAIVAIVIVAPLMAADVLPTPFENVIFTSTDMPKPPEPPPPAGGPVTQSRAPMPVTPVDRSAAPVEPAEQIGVEDPAPVVPGPPGIKEVGDPAGIPGGTGKGLGLLPPAPQAPPVQEPIPVGGKIRNPTKVKDARPVYPQIAIASRVEGRVIIQATLDVDGRVTNARVLRSIPLLDQAALDAVREWQFTPTLLNGVAVPVIMTVTVNFALK